MLFYHALLSIMLIFSKPHTNACIVCECMFIEVTIYCTCYNVSRGTWCASERVSTNVARICWLWETVTVKQRKRLLSAAVLASKTEGSDSGRSKLASKTAGTSHYQTANIYTSEESSQWALSNNHRWSLRIPLMWKLLVFLIFPIQISIER